MGKKSGTFFPTSLRSTGAPSHLCYSKFILSSCSLFASHSALTERLINSEGTRKKTIPEEATYFDKVCIFFFLFPVTAFQRTSTSIFIWGVIGQNMEIECHFRCERCDTVGGCTLGGENLERRWETPCTNHELNIAQLLQPTDKGSEKRRQACETRGENDNVAFLLSCLCSSFSWSLVYMTLTLLTASHMHWPGVNCPLLIIPSKAAEFSKKQDPASRYKAKGRGR